MNNPTWDLLILVFAIVAIVFGVAMGRERSMVGVLASYIGLVVANFWGNAVYGLIGGQTSAQVGSAVAFSATASPFFIKAGIFILILVLLIIKGDFLKRAMTSHVGLNSIITSVIYSALNAGLIIMALTSFLGDSQRTSLLEQSKIINMVTQYQTWLVVLPVVMMIFLGFKDKGEE